MGLQLIDVYGTRTAAPRPATIRLDSSRRSAQTWPEAFEKMRALIAAELASEDADHEYWSNEMEALNYADASYRQNVRRLDEQIATLQRQRQAAIGAIADGLVVWPGNNLSHFLPLDNPGNYLRW